MKYLLYYLAVPILLITHIAAAQIIESPQFPQPESTFYALLQEDKINYSKGLNGKIIEVTTTYREVMKPLGLQFVQQRKDTFDVNGHVLKTTVKKGNEPMLVHHQWLQTTEFVNGMKVITMRSNHSATHQTIAFWYQDNLIVKQVQGNDIYDDWEETYTYDKKGRLIKRQKYDLYYDPLDYSSEGEESANRKLIETEIATYENGLLVSKEHYTDREEVIDLTQIKYQYHDNGKLNHYLIEHHSLVPNSTKALEFPLSQEYIENNRIEEENERIRGSYSYNDDYDITAFFIFNQDLDYFEEEYHIAYETQKITINGIFWSCIKGCHQAENLTKEMVEYEYLFDKYQNPRQVLSYKVAYAQADKYQQSEAEPPKKKTLDKETTIDILYDQ